MKICLESYLLVNFMMNALILDLAARALGRRRPARVLAAAALGGVWAVVIYLPRMAWLGSLPMRLAVPALMAIAACGVRGVRDAASVAAAVMCMTLLLGGGALLISLMSGGWGWSQLGWCLTAGGSAGLWLTSAHLKRCWGWELKLGICDGGRRRSITALVDTGNRLREPISGACVLIASERSLRALLPEDFDARGPGLPSSRWRMVYYTALGETGRMKCFCPERIEVRAGQLCARRSDVWVAVYPGELPGGAQALAPLELSCAPGRRAEGGEIGNAGYSLKS